MAARCLRDLRGLDCAEELLVKAFTSWQSGSDPAGEQTEQKSEKGVFCRGYQKAGTAGFTPHTMIDAPRLAVDEITRI